MSIYAQRLRIAIDHALAISYRRTAVSQAGVYVAHIEIVKGIPFYGYYVGYRPFLKIYLFNPAHITRLADLLRQGAVMMKPIQPYESHMQYVPQWMCDNNLYGCAYLESKKVIFRSPVPEYQDLEKTDHVWHNRSISPSIISVAEKFPRQSHCPIEVDLCVEDITNRLEIEERRLHHDFIGQEHSIPKDQKLVHSMAGLWRDETRRRKARMGLKDSDGSPFPPEVLVSVSADPRNTTPGGWIHEDEYRTKLNAEVMEEDQGPRNEDTAFSTFVEPQPGEGNLRTAFESVTDLFTAGFQPKNSLLARDSGAGKSSELPVEGTGVEVDETRILAIQDEGFSDSDGESIDTVTMPLENDDAKSVPGVGATPAQSMQQSKGGLGVADGEALTETSDSARLSAMPNSSSELEELGVRNAGNYSEIVYDSFDIQPEYRSNISKTTTQNHTTGEISNLSNGPRKRRKLVKDSVNPRRHIDVSEARAQEEQPVPTPAHDHVADDGDSEENEGHQMYPDLDLQDRKVELSPGAETNYTKNSERLPFPIVKDPQDPSTVQRLSQQSQKHREAEKHEKKNIVSEVQVVALAEEARVDSENNTTPRPSSADTLTKKPPSRAVHVISALPKSLHIGNWEAFWGYAFKPPSSRKLFRSFKQHGIASVQYQAAYYGDEADVPEIEREYAGKGFRLESTTVPYLADFAPTRLHSPRACDTQSATKSAVAGGYGYARATCSIRNWEIKQLPPRRAKISKWLLARGTMRSPSGQVLPNAKHEIRSQIDAATQKHKHGFKYSQKQADTSVRHETQYMSLMSLEVHVNTRGSLNPDPEQDAVSCIFWCFQPDGSEVQSNEFREKTNAGVLIMSGSGDLAQKLSRQVKVNVGVEGSELDLLNRMVDIVRDLDPDILTGFEVHNSSWGYLIERARRQYDYDLCEEFSRTKSQSHGRIGKTLDPWGFNHTSTIRITGRHMINIWRAMRGELNLLQYTLENIVFHILHRRVPQYAHKDLTRWYTSGKPREFVRVVDYQMMRTRLDLDILHQNELIPRTSEQARLLGVDFFSVFSRGSQFKVESLMFRIAKPENFILISPSRKQVGQQNALECLPLVMEPQSAFYPSPLLVLDFQSLYPSVMIAYNYCYSTFLGRVVKWRDQNKMGFTDYERQQRVLKLLKDHVNIAPNGMIYARPEIRKSLLAKMLGEILETRVMVKSGMKVDRDDKTLQRLLNNRQLALKLIANVTYGYTSASFSGRMPCSEIADSIVQTGRETLEKAIALIHSVKRWGAEVVYGDTDSLFVYLKGRTRGEAFDIGKEIAAAVTSMNPKPVKLKFEKVYHPCVLLAKKRYVGFKYETKEQMRPDFDAKGIETVRRDGTPAEQKIEEKALKLLFRTANLSSVKSYFQKQCTKIMKGQISIQDFCFAREVKLGTYHSDKGPPPPGALISTRRMLEDPRAEPQYGERVPYVVIAGAPGARLIDRCVAPDILLQDNQHELDAEYYITKNLIPPLERIFNLVGANVKQWYDEMPKYQKVRRTEILAEESKQLILNKKTLESYLKASACMVCKRRLEEAEFPICPQCIKQPQASLLILKQKLLLDERRALSLHEVCASCAGLPLGDEVRCRSKDCPVFYTRTRHMALLNSERGVVDPLIRILEDVDEETLQW